MEDHNHQLNCADGLRRLRSSSDTRSTFHSYFKDGLAPAEALHQQKLAVEDDGVEQLANGALNPSANTVYHLFRVWHKDHYGDAVEPLSKLEEKAPLYLQNGALQLLVECTYQASRDADIYAPKVIALLYCCLF